MYVRVVDRVSIGKLEGLGYPVGEIGTCLGPPRGQLSIVNANELIFDDDATYGMPSFTKQVLLLFRQHVV